MGTQSNIGGFNVVLLSVHARYCSYGANLCSFSNRVSTLIQKNRENDGASAPFFFLRASGSGLGIWVGLMPTYPELFIRTAKNPHRPKIRTIFTRIFSPYFFLKIPNNCSNFYPRKFAVFLIKKI